jgi:precorrin-2 methylase
MNGEIRAAASDGDTLDYAKEGDVLIYSTNGNLLVAGRRSQRSDGPTASVSIPPQ